jgi:hypothetical protein
MDRYSCNLNGNRWKDDCTVEQPESPDGEPSYGNNFTSHAIPDATAVLIIEMEQHNMKRLTLHVTAEDPSNADEILVDQERVGFRHADSAYEDD